MGMLRALRRLFVVGMAASALTGCDISKTAQAPEPPVHNVVTEYVDQGVTAMNKAEDVKEKLNAQNQKMAAQLQQIDEGK